MAVALEDGPQAVRVVDGPPHEHARHHEHVRSRDVLDLSKQIAMPRKMIQMFIPQNARNDSHIVGG